VSNGDRHWAEYLIEGTLLGLFMVSACAFKILLEYPASLRQGRARRHPDPHNRG